MGGRNLYRLSDLNLNTISKNTSSFLQHELFEILVNIASHPNEILNLYSLDPKCFVFCESAEEDAKVDLFYLMVFTELTINGGEVALPGAFEDTQHNDNEYEISEIMSSGGGSGSGREG